jgi:hypothetical protein
MGSNLGSITVGDGRDKRKEEMGSRWSKYIESIYKQLIMKPISKLQ